MSAIAWRSAPPWGNELVTKISRAMGPAQNLSTAGMGADVLRHTLARMRLTRLFTDDYRAGFVQDYPL